MPSSRLNSSPARKRYFLDLFLFPGSSSSNNLPILLSILLNLSLKQKHSTPIITIIPLRTKNKLLSLILAPADYACDAQTLATASSRHNSWCNIRPRLTSGRLPQCRRPITTHRRREAPPSTIPLPHQNIGKWIAIHTSPICTSHIVSPLKKVKLITPSNMVMPMQIELIRPY